MNINCQEDQQCDPDTQVEDINQIGIPQNACLKYAGLTKSADPSEHEKAPQLGFDPDFESEQKPKLNKRYMRTDRQEKKSQI